MLPMARTAHAPSTHGSPGKGLDPHGRLVLPECSHIAGLGVASPDHGHAHKALHCHRCRSPHLSIAAPRSLFYGNGGVFMREQMYLQTPYQLHKQDQLVSAIRTATLDGRQRYIPGLCEQHHVGEGIDVGP